MERFGEMSNNPTKNIVALTGGGGGAKLVYGLAQIVPPEKLTIIVNTGDDFEHLGLHISPDLDKVMYTLAEIGYPGQGIKNESWNMMAAMARYDGPTWFQLGDWDLATQLLRSKWLRDGYPLNWVTKELSRRLGVRHPILPMSESRVRTIIQTAAGEFGPVAYFAQKPSPPEVQGIHFAGADEAQSSREVISALRDADVMIFGPSNPLLSLDPILSIPNLRRIIAASRAPKIGISGIVGGEVSEPMAKIMTGVGMEISPVGIARHLREVLTGFVINHVDEAYQDELTDMRLRTLVTGIVMKRNEERVRLAQEVLAFALATPLAQQPNN
jgi:LPPG:FO 2-phospho-L-lactate transferase